MNEKAKKYIKDNTLDLNKDERMDTTGHASLAVSVGKAYGAIAIAEDSVKEKAIEEYISTCADRVFGLCSTVSSRTPFNDNIYGCLGRDCLKVKNLFKTGRDGK